MNWLKNYRENKRLETIMRRYGGQNNMAMQCSACDFWRCPRTVKADGTVKYGNWGCEVPSLKTKDFRGNTCLKWTPRNKTNPLRLVVSGR